MVIWWVIVLEVVVDDVIDVVCVCIVDKIVFGDLCVEGVIMGLFVLIV